MRKFRLTLGFVLLVGGVVAAGYFIVRRNQYEGGDDANSILESVAGHEAPVGFYMNLTLAGASAIVAVVGLQLVRKNRLDRSNE